MGYCHCAGSKCLFWANLHNLHLFRFERAKNKSYRLEFRHNHISKGIMQILYTSGDNVWSMSYAIFNQNLFRRFLHCAIFEQ